MRTSELYQRYYGIYVGKVVSVEDPQRLGRIRIECAQFEESEADPLWAVVARPGGGGTSVFFTPDVGDQVIFGFQVGDVNGPVILGYAHHSGDHEPPQEVDAATKKHAIVTSIGSVVFDEENKQIVVTLNDPKSTITMKNDGITLDVGSNNVFVKAGNVFVGSGDAKEHIPLGDTLSKWLQGHTHPTAMGPSGQPTNDFPFPIDQVLSKKNTVD